MPPAFSPFRWLLPCVAALAGCLGFMAVWTFVAVLSGKAHAWLALLAAVDIAFMLRLARAPEGRGRIALAVCATALAIAGGLWLIVATRIGLVMGLDPLNSALRLGPVLFEALTRLSLGTLDYALILLSLPLAAWLTRPRR
ncbi:hypothetical protein [Arenimonas sp.]|uniref:hypothetical protein n=1 Tax=Arenimonas sp. TaxID=1872635 RepID=UPI0039E61CB1